MSGRSVVLLVRLTSLAALWAKDDQISFWSHGPGSGMTPRAHPLPCDELMLVRWQRDRAIDEHGWRVWAALQIGASGYRIEAARQHLGHRDISTISAHYVEKKSAWKSRFQPPAGSCERWHLELSPH